MQRYKTLRFDRYDLEVLAAGMHYWYMSGEYSEKELERLHHLLDRLGKNLGDMNWDLRQAQKQEIDKCS